MRKTPLNNNYIFMWPEGVFRCFSQEDIFRLGILWLQFAAESETLVLKFPFGAILQTATAAAF